MKPLAALLVLLSATAWSAPVRVRVVGDTCPLAAQLKGANGLAVVDAGQDFDVMLEREGDEWRVRLTGADGSVALRRTLTGAKLCADVTFAAQLILERFARELDVKVAVPAPAPAPVPVPPKPEPATPPVPLPPLPKPVPLPPPPPAPEPEPEPVPPPAPVVLLVPPAVQTSTAFPAALGTRARGLRVSRVELAASGAAWLAWESPARPGFAADLAIFLSEALRFSVQFAITAPETSLVFDDRGAGLRGKLVRQPYLATATGGYCQTFGVRGCGSLVAGAHLESASTEGDYVFAQKNLLRAVPAFGVELQVAWLPVPQLVFALSGTLLVLPVTAGWNVEQIASATRSTPSFEGLVRLSIGFGANR